MFKDRKIGGAIAPGSSILVVTEGENTEPIYFEAIRRVFSSSSVELVSHGAGRGDPKRLVDAALELRRERRRMAKNKELSITQLEDFDEIWIVFDTDVLTADKRNSGITYAEGKGIKIAYSEPCFEFWLLLHGAYTTALMPKCADVVPYLLKAFSWAGYSKNKEEAKIQIPPLVTKERIANALKSAERVRNHHRSAGTGFPANPSMDVDRLVHAINNVVAVANKII